MEPLTRLKDALMAAQDALNGAAGGQGELEELHHRVAF
jgi:hypothetical protein